MTLSLKASVTRRQTAVPVDQPERLLQAEHHHQVAENARQTAVEAATAVEPEQQGKGLKPTPHALQSAFLSGNLGRSVVVYLVNGIRLVGRLRQFDQYCLLLEGSDGLPQLVFKHATSTIAPLQAGYGRNM